MLTGADAAIYWERAVLGILLESPSRWRDTQLRTEDFATNTHKQIFEAICRLHAEHRDADLVEVAAEVGDKISISYVAGLIDGVVRPNFEIYVRHVRRASRLRQVQRIAQQLFDASTLDECRSLIKSAANLLESENGQ